jgi:hypothetical protein
MGVGCYGNDFHGTGKSLLVSGPLGYDSDYEEFVKSQRQDGVAEEAILDKAEWTSEEYSDFNLDLIEAIEGYAKDIGLSVVSRKGFQGPRATFDSEFVQLLDSKCIEVGWRSWDTDFVIAVGPSGSFKDWMQDAQGYAEDIVNETGRAPSTVSELYGSLVLNVHEYIRLRLQAEGTVFECRYKTSGYTSAAYERVANDEAATHIKDLEGSIKTALQRLEADGYAAMRDATGPDLIALVKALDDLHADNLYGLPGQIYMEVPVFDRANNVGVGFNPYTSGPIASKSLPEGVLSYMRDQDGDENLIAILRCAATEDWFKAIQAKSKYGLDRLIVSADEFAAATGRDLVVSLDDQHDVLLARAPGQDASPSP